MRFAYPAELTASDGAVTITFPDVPGAISEGVDRAEALERGAEALVSMLAAMAEDGEALPAPSPARGRPLVAVTALEAAKLALNDAMRERAVTNVALAAQLDMDERAIRRLRDALHASRIADVERALAALGKRIIVDVADAA
jgi:antitoxin HicB